MADARGPQWVRDNWDRRVGVDFSEDALQHLRDLLPRCKLYPNTEAGFERALAAMTQCLSLDMRSAHRGRMAVDTDEEVYRWDFDKLTACWVMRGGSVVVEKIEPRSKRAVRLAKEERVSQELRRTLKETRAKK